MKFNLFKSSVTIKTKNPYPKVITNQSNDTTRIIANFVDSNDIASLMKTCKKSYALYKSSLTSVLLQAVVYGQYNRVNKLLSKHPELLLKKGTVKDYSGRIHKNRTAFQLALGKCDYNVTTVDDTVLKGMIEMIAEHFKKLPHKTIEQINNIMSEQYVGQFPDGTFEKEEKRVKNDVKALQKITIGIKAVAPEDCDIVSAIDHDIYQIVCTEQSVRADKLRTLTSSVLKANSDKAFESAFAMLIDYLITNKFIRSDIFNIDLFKSLYQFRNYLEPKEPLMHGKHFNHSLFKKAFLLGIENYLLFGNDWHTAKNQFYWQKVFGYIQRFIPACDAQLIAHGLYFVLTYVDSQDLRSLKTQRGDYYYPLDSNAKYKIGYNCFFDAGYRQQGSWGYDARFAAQPAIMYFKDLCEKKASLPMLIQHTDLQPEKNHRCVVL